MKFIIINKTRAKITYKVKIEEIEGPILEEHNFKDYEKIIVMSSSIFQKIDYRKTPNFDKKVFFKIEKDEKSGRNVILSSMGEKEGIKTTKIELKEKFCKEETDKYFDFIKFDGEISFSNFYNFFELKKFQKCLNASKTVRIYASENKDRPLIIRYNIKDIGSVFYTLHSSDL